MADIVISGKSTDPAQAISRTTIGLREPATERLRLRILGVQWGMN